MAKKIINLNLSVKEKNKILAENNRALFKKAGLKVLNIISSPGSGKTTLLEATAEKLKGKLAVIVGDVFTTADAERIEKHGCQAVQIETKGGCHLNAEMVKKAYDKLALENVEILIIENIGNLVCPSTYDLGEDEKIAMLSFAEGDEKPSKYPALFSRASTVIFSKIDFKELVDFDINRAKNDCRKLNSNIAFIELSVTKNLGMDKWFSYLSSL